MADKGGAKGEAAPAKPGRRKLLIIAAALVALLGGGGAAAYFLVFAARAGADPSGEAGLPSEVEAQADAGHEDEAQGRPGALFVDMPDLLVNLQSDGKRMRFLRLRLALEVGDARTADSVKALTPRVLDSFQMYLRSLTVEEVQGSAGMQRLKEEMIARVNLAIEPSRIRDVLFKEILVQ